MANSIYSPFELFSMEACTGCRVCADVCPAVTASGDGQLSGLHRLDWRRRAGKAQAGWLRRFWERPPSRAQWRDFGETVFRCTLCGNCSEACPVGIDLKDIWLKLRQELMEQGCQPNKVDRILDNLAGSHNVFDEDQEDRVEWVEDMDEPPDHGYEKEKADVVYFTGCVASYFPLAQQIPVALAEVFDAAQVDFTLLGEDEWCCGFPLLGAGALPQARKLIEHNVEAVKAKGGRQIIFACPSCYMMWLEYYPREFELAHTTQFLASLVEKGRLSFNERPLKVTYHDPCDLGRGARVFDEPRRVIRSLPGVELVEMAQNRENCLCCGGGGNLEMIDQHLNGQIARRKVEQVLDTGAGAVVSACQQCLRTMATQVRRNKLPLKVMDIAQLVRRSLLV